MRFMMLMIPKGYESAAPGTIMQNPRCPRRFAAKGVVSLGGGLRPHCVHRRVSVV